MEMFVPQDQVVSYSILQHNLNQVKYKPKRNALKIGLKIGFSNNYDRTILNDQIIFRINFLESIGITRFDEIRTTNFTWFLKLNDVLTEIQLEKLLTDPTLIYLEIGKKLYRNNLMIDVINGLIIKYNPSSFRQLDDSIKFTLYEILSDSVKSENLYVIGGEALFFIRLLNPKKYILYTDFESIYVDATINLDNPDNIHLISYESDSIKMINNSEESFDVILNTSKHGLGVNLCRNILKLNQNRVIIISCNKRSFERDMKILGQRYKIERQIDIETNYIVTVYFLQLQL